MPFDATMQGAVGQNKGRNKFQQVRDQVGATNQGGGIGPSMGMMGKAMGGMKPGMRVGQAMGRANPAGMMGGLGNAMGLGGFKQQRQVGGNRPMPFQPRQDMGMDYGNTGMSNTQLPVQPLPEQQPMMEQQPPIQEDPYQARLQQAMSAYGPKNSAMMRGRGMGIGPRFM
jgi:hypothetical protein